MQASALRHARSRCWPVGNEAKAHKYQVNDIEVHSANHCAERQQRQSIGSQAGRLDGSPEYLAPRQRRSASMHVASPAQDSQVPMQLRRASMPSSPTAPQPVQVVQKQPYEEGSLSYRASPRHTADTQRFKMPPEPRHHEALPMKVPGRPTTEEGFAVPSMPPQQQAATMIMGGGGNGYAGAGASPPRRASAQEAGEAATDGFLGGPREALRLPRRLSIQPVMQAPVSHRYSGAVAEVQQSGYLQTQPQQPEADGGKESVAHPPQAPQMRRSRPSEGAPLGVTADSLGSRAASLLPRAIRSSLAAARRASAPVAALPLIAEEPPAMFSRVTSDIPPSKVCMKSRPPSLHRP